MASDLELTQPTSHTLVGHGRIQTQSSAQPRAPWWAAVLWDRKCRVCLDFPTLLALLGGQRQGRRGSS